MTPPASTSIRTPGRNSIRPRVGACSALPRNARCELGARCECGAGDISTAASGRQANLVMPAQKAVAHRLRVAERFEALALKILGEGRHALVVAGQQPLLGGGVQKGVVERVAAEL